MPPWEKYQSTESAGPWSKYGQAAPAPAVEEPVQPASLMDKVVGSAAGRTALGLASPLIGAAQAGAHVGDMINEATGQRKIVSPWIDEKLKELDASKKRGMEHYGHDKDSVDWMGMMASFLPGAAIAKGVAKAVPAATTLAGKMGVGAVTGGVAAGAQPMTETENFATDKGSQIAGGAAVGGLLPAVTQGVKSFLGTNRLNPTQASTLNEGHAAGYVTPPSAINPSGLNNTLESVAGKAAVGQEAAARNQKVTNALTAKSLGLPADKPVTPGAIQSVRNVADKAYEEVEKLSPTAQTALRELRDARHKTNLHFKHYFKSADPDALDNAEYHKGLSKLFEQEIENEARQAGRPQLVKALTDARMKIAKTYDIEKALSEADSNVSAPTLGRLFDSKGGKAVTGEIATIGKMAEAFPSVMREGAKVPTAGVSGTDAAASAILGTMGYGAAGPAGLMAAAMPAVRPLARHAVLSPFYQKHLAEGIPARYLPIIEAMTQQASGAGGTAVGRNQ